MSNVSAISGSKNVLPFVPRSALAATAAAADTTRRREATTVSAPFGAAARSGWPHVPLRRTLIYRGLPNESAAPRNDNAAANVIEEFAVKAGFLPVEAAASDAFFFDGDAIRACRCPPPPPRPPRALTRTDVLATRGDAA